MTVLPGGDPNDIRFQFEVIRQLAENGRVMAQNIGKLQETQVAMLERMAKIEANTVNEAVARIEIKVDQHGSAIDKLEQMEDRRVGESASRAAFIKWWPVIAATLMVVWIVGRAIGFFHIPEPPQRAAVQSQGGHL